MVKGKRRFFPIRKDAKWFAHTETPENEPQTYETDTSTGIMLSQIKSSLPEALRFERFPKWKTDQKSREYPLSDHDNKYAFQDDVSIFSLGVGRRKCRNDRSQCISHFNLHHGADGSTGEDLTNYQADFTEKPPVNVPTATRRFTRDHKHKSEEAAEAQAGQKFFWFGRVDSDNPPETLQVLAATM